MSPFLLAISIALALPLLAAAAHPGCDADVCFALSGDPKSFPAQQNVVGGAAKRLADWGGRTSFAAVQYTTGSLGDTGISPSEANQPKFSAALYGSRANGGKLFPTAGINYCFAQLNKRRRAGGKRLIIVLLGPGGSELGSSPVKRAALFSRIGGTVFAVGIGQHIRFGDLKDISQSWWRTMNVADFKTPWATGFELANRICKVKA